MRQSHLAEKIIILTLTLLAFLLRVYRLAEQSYWIEEAWTLYFARLPFAELLHLLQVEEPKPPFYYFAALYWIKLVGEGEYALRFFSLIFGVAAVPLTYRLGKALDGPRLGLLAALLITVAPFQIWHSQEARMYSILTATSLLSMLGFVQWWQRGGWRWWLIYVIGTLWAILTHYHGLVLIGIQGLFLLLTWRRHWRGYLAWGGTLGLIALLLVPWLFFGGALLQSFLHWLTQPTLWETYVRGSRAYTVGEFVPPEQAGPLVLAFVAVYILGLSYAWSRRWRQWRGPELVAFLLAYTIAPNLATWLYGELRTPVYFERYLIPIQVGFLLAVALGILGLADWLKGRRPLAWGLAGLLTVGLVGINGWVLAHHYFDPVYAKPNWRGVIAQIEAHSLPGDAILMTGDGGEKLFDYYYQGDLPVYYDFNTPVPPPDQARQIIAEIAGRHRRLWYTPYGVEIDATLEQWLAENSYPAWQSWLGRKRLALYATQADLPRREVLDHHFPDASGQGPTLTEAALPGQPVAAGDLLPLALIWRTDAPLTLDAQLSLRLVNPAGDVFTQSDWPPLTATRPSSTWPAGQALTDRRSLWLPVDLPPGDYALQLVVYNPESGQPLGQPALVPNISVGPATLSPPLDSQAIPNFAQRALGPVTLLGYAAPERLQPGQAMWLWLYWRAERPLAGEPMVRLSLSSDGQTVTSDLPLAELAGPLDGWQSGQLRRTVYHLPTSPRLTGNQAGLSVALLSAEGQIERQTELTRLDLENRTRQFEQPAVQHPLDVSLGDPPRLRLLGYDLPQPALSPGETLPLTLHWQAETELETNYTIFVQLLDAGGQVVAQVDAPPLAGAAPTTTWLPPEIVSDGYTLTLPENLPPGDYHLIAGMYDSASGARLPVAGGGNFVGLERVRVK